VDQQAKKPVEDWKTDFDHLDKRFTDNPYPIYSELRDKCPVAHSDRYGGMAVLTTMADIDKAVHDTQTFTSRRVFISEVPTDRRGLILPPINLDPPDHTDRRRALLPYFTPSSMGKWEQPIRDICADLLAKLDGRTECDAAVDYAQEVPGQLTALMLGVPVEDASQFRDWIHDLLELGPADPVLSRHTTEIVLDYMEKLVERRRAENHEGRDLVAYLFTQELDGEPISDRESARMLFLLMIAGIDTTWSAIGFGLLHLGAHPEDRNRLVAEPELIPTAVEEFLRAFSPVNVARIATTETEISGCPVREGDWTLLAFGSANRDPELFEDADQVVIDRAANRHAAFGLGVHRCLGSNLARTEIVIAVEAWLEKYPKFAVTDIDAVTYAGGIVRGPRSIPVTLG
jgi:cytochrome P450